MKEIDLDKVKTTQEEETLITDDINTVVLEINKLFGQYNLTIKEGLLVNHLMLVPLLVDIKENFHYDHGFCFEGIKTDITTMIRLTESEKK